VGKSRYGTPPDVQLREDGGTGSSQVERVRLRIVRTSFRVADPGPAFYFNVAPDPDPAPNGDANLRPLVHRPCIDPL
jgi:hypothetical protein